MTVEHLVLMGVAGSGKTTVAEILTERTGRPYAEADDFHPAENVAKMQAGTPLDDADRAPWLAAMRDWLTTQADAGRSTVVTCSALRRPYRDTLREARGRVRFVHLDGSPDLLAERIGARAGHFMGAGMLASQLETLEPLDPDEDGIRLDVAAAPHELADAALAPRDSGSSPTD
ncbi:gluconokinase [Paraoerskovia marina]|uniref:gluconokinase n=1 Tax=Paraoerskovia marina TaxID=545619 RepID=UPI0005B7736F|nr:gluconokinase [Paraoerskovia marina]